MLMPPPGVDVAAMYASIEDGLPSLNTEHSSPDPEHVHVMPSVPKLVTVDSPIGQARQNPSETVPQVNPSGGAVDLSRIVPRVRQTTHQHEQ